VIELSSQLPACVMAMEACCGAHHLGRILSAHGHRVRLMSPEYVQPYVKAQKNDERDAEAIAEAATRPTMRFVDLKSEEQLDMQSLHRARSRLVGERTALINQLRAVLLERGIIVAQGRRRLAQYLSQALDGDEAAPLQLSSRIRLLIEDMRAQWRELDRRVAEFDGEFVAAAAARQQQGGYRPFPVSELSTRPRWWRPSATRGVLLAPAILLPGWDLCRGKRPREAGPACSDY
jgi:transposase